MKTGLDESIENYEDWERTGFEEYEEILKQERLREQNIVKPKTIGYKQSLLMLNDLSKKVADIQYIINTLIYKTLSE